MNNFATFLMPIYERRSSVLLTILFCFAQPLVVSAARLITLTKSGTPYIAPDTREWYGGGNKLTIHVKVEDSTGVQSFKYKWVPNISNPDTDSIRRRSDGSGGWSRPFPTVVDFDLDQYPIGGCSMPPPGCSSYPHAQNVKVAVIAGNEWGVFSDPPATSGPYWIDQKPPSICLEARDHDGDRGVLWGCDDDISSLPSTLAGDIPISFKLTARDPDSGLGRFDATVSRLVSRGQWSPVSPDQRSLSEIPFLLRTAGSYRFSATAVDHVGNSKTITKTVVVSSVTAAPREFSGIARSSNVVKFTWRAPYRTLGLKHYRIIGDVWQDTISATALSAEVDIRQRPSDLRMESAWTPNFKVKASVWACYTDNCDAFADSNPFTTYTWAEGVDRSTVSVPARSPSTATIQWDTGKNPPLDELSDPRNPNRYLGTKYKLYYRKAIEPPPPYTVVLSTQVVLLGIHSMNKSLSSLAPNTRYVFHIDATNGDFTHDTPWTPTDDRDFWTKPVAPVGPPTAAEIGTSTIAATFRFPNPPAVSPTNPAGTRYILQASTSSNFRGARLFETGPSVPHGRDASHVEVSGLDPETAYYLRVKVISDMPSATVDDHAYSPIRTPAVTTLQLPLVPPTATVDASLSALSSTKFRLTINVGAQRHPATHLEVKYKGWNGQEQSFLKPISDLGLSFSLDVPVQRPDTQYTDTQYTNIRVRIGPNSNPNDRLWSAFADASPTSAWTTPAPMTVIPTFSDRTTSSLTASFRLARDNPDSSLYILQASTAPNFPPNLIKESAEFLRRVDPFSDNEATVGSLESAIGYYLRLRTKSASGNTALDVFGPRTPNPISTRPGSGRITEATYNTLRAVWALPSDFLPEVNELRAEARLPDSSLAKAVEQTRDRTRTEQKFILSDLPRSNTFYQLILYQKDSGQEWKQIPESEARGWTLADVRTGPSLQVIGRRGNLSIKVNLPTHANAADTLYAIRVAGHSPFPSGYLTGTNGPTRQGALSPVAVWRSSVSWMSADPPINQLTGIDTSSSYSIQALLKQQNPSAELSTPASAIDTPGTMKIISFGFASDLLPVEVDDFQHCAPNAAIRVSFSAPLATPIPSNRIILQKRTGRNTWTNQQNLAFLFADESHRTLLISPTDLLEPKGVYRLFIRAGIEDPYGSILEDEFKRQLVIHRDPAQSTTVVSPNDDSDRPIQLTIPVGALSSEGCAFLRPRFISPPAPLTLTPDVLSKLSNGSIKPLQSSPMEVLVYQHRRASPTPSPRMAGADSTDGERANRPLTLMVPLQDTDLRGFASVGLYQFTPQGPVLVAGSQINTSDNSLSASILNSGVYIVAGVPFSNTNTIYAYPVPFQPNRDNRQSQITFTNVPNGTHIKIFTVNGDLVRELTASDDTGQVRWDVKNVTGDAVASDVYLYVAEANGIKTTGKLVIIR